MSYFSLVQFDQPMPKKLNDQLVRRFHGLLSVVYSNSNRNNILGLALISTSEFSFSSRRPLPFDPAKKRKSRFAQEPCPINEFYAIASFFNLTGTLTFHSLPFNSIPDVFGQVVVQKDGVSFRALDADELEIVAASPMGGSEYFQEQVKQRLARKTLELKPLIPVTDANFFTKSTIVYNEFASGFSN